MKALVLAAGYATRLYPLTRTFPKPLLEVAGRPMIDYIVDKLDAIEAIDEIIVVTNSKFYRKFLAWAKAIDVQRRARGARARISVVDDLTRSEEDRRGAIGDMEFVRKAKRVTTDLLVVGGDNLFDGSLVDFTAFARRHASAPVIGVYDIKSRRKAVQYGVVKVDARRKVTRFQEKSPRPSSSLVAMCLYYFPKGRLTLLARYLKDKGHKRDATGFYIDWLQRTIDVYAYVFGGRWYDIGHLDFYRKAQASFSISHQP